MPGKCFTGKMFHVKHAEDMMKECLAEREDFPSFITLRYGSFSAEYAALFTICAKNCTVYRVLTLIN